MDAVWEVAPAHRRAELRLLTIHTALAVRDRVRAQELVEEATRGGEVCAELVSVRARLDWYRGRHAEAQEGFREAMILADAEGDGIVGAWSRIHLSGLLEWAGAVEEARAVLPIWDPAALWAKAIGAPELIAHLRGGLPLDEARLRAQAASRQYAKRQRTWFRRRMRDWAAIALP